MKGMTSNYYYVRFKWWEPVDLQKVIEEFPDFKTKKIRQNDSKDISPHKDERDEFKVEADTLQAMLSVFRAILYQKETKPFTVRDMELREKVMKIYPRSRPMPLPLLFSSEPKFEKEKS